MPTNLGICNNDRAHNASHIHQQTEYKRSTGYPRDTITASPTLPETPICCRSPAPGPSQWRILQVALVYHIIPIMREACFVAHMVILVFHMGQYTTHPQGNPYTLHHTTMPQQCMRTRLSAVTRVRRDNLGLADHQCLNKVPCRLVFLLFRLIRRRPFQPVRIDVIAARPHAPAMHRECLYLPASVIFRHCVVDWFSTETVLVNNHARIGRAG